MANIIKGGLADNKTLEDICNKHRCNLEDLNQQLLMGLKVEKEHADNPGIAKEIAMDHLWEDPKYYDKLKKVEESMKLVNLLKEDKISDFLSTPQGKKYIELMQNLHKTHDALDAVHNSPRRSGDAEAYKAFDRANKNELAYRVKYILPNKDLEWWKVQDEVDVRLGKRKVKNENILKESDSLFKIKPAVAYEIYDILKKEVPEITKKFPNSNSFFYLINGKLK